MSDLIKTLRFMEHSASLAAAPIIKEAADEIERLRAGVLAWKLLLESLAYKHQPDGDVQIMAQRIDGAVFENAHDAANQQNVGETK